MADYEEGKGFWEKTGRLTYEGLVLMYKEVMQPPHFDGS
jgi:hypothetical protein